MGLPEMGMTRAAVEEAVMRGPRIEVGLVTSSLRVRGSRGVALVAAAAALRSKPSALPLGARWTNGGAAPEQWAGVHPAAARSTSAGGEAMDCDDDGHDWVGDTGTHRGGKRVRGGGDGGGGRKGRPCDVLR